jgi:hypothetical protein
MAMVDTLRQLYSPFQLDHLQEEKKKTANPTTTMTTTTVAVALQHCVSSLPFSFSFASMFQVN